MVRKRRTRLARLYPEDILYLNNIKEKNGLESLAEATKRMTEFIEGEKKKRKLRKKITREIEF
jgi:hypothetical protein